MSVVASMLSKDAVSGKASLLDPYVLVVTPACFWPPMPVPSPTRAPIVRASERSSDNHSVRSDSCDTSDWTHSEPEKGSVEKSKVPRSIFLNVLVPLLGWFEQAETTCAF